MRKAVSDRVYIISLVVIFLLRVLAEAHLFRMMVIYAPNAKPNISKKGANNPKISSFKSINSALIILYSCIKQAHSLNLKEFDGRPLAGVVRLRRRPVGLRGRLCDRGDPAQFVRTAADQALDARKMYG